VKRPSVDATCVHGFANGRCVTCVAYRDEPTLSGEHEHLYRAPERTGADRASIDAEHHPAFWRGPDPTPGLVPASRWDRTSHRVDSFRATNARVEQYRAEYGYKLRRKGTISNERTVDPLVAEVKRQRTTSTDPDFDRALDEATARLREDNAARAERLGVTL
jgi:hypothetical protein